jgi:hypothetical protein
VAPLFIHPSSVRLHQLSEAALPAHVAISSHVPRAFRADIDLPHNLDTDQVAYLTYRTYPTFSSSHDLRLYIPSSHPSIRTDPQLIQPCQYPKLAQLRLTQ